MVVDQSKIEEKVLNAEFNLIEVEKKIFEKIRLLIINNIKNIQCNADILAKLDVLSSHASLSYENNYSKPIFSKEVKLDFKFKNKDTILFGRESLGVPKKVHDNCFQRLKIPLIKNARSLNIGMATAITLSEALRQNSHL